jgi:D-tyrosyl-tRNA(Tyr) deacylase
VRLVIQRVSRAEVRAQGRVVGKIGHGLLVLVGAERGDDGVAAEEAARKIAGLRIFEDAQAKMNLALADVGGGVLVVSQFTLAADLSRGRRPGFEKALPASEARPIYEHFAKTLEILGLPVAIGAFGEKMEVELVNDGPATFVMTVESRESKAES